MKDNRDGAVACGEKKYVHVEKYVDGWGMKENNYGRCHNSFAEFMSSWQRTLHPILLFLFPSLDLFAPSCLRTCSEGPSIMTS